MKALIFKIQMFYTTFKCTKIAKIINKLISFIKYTVYEIPNSSFLPNNFSPKLKQI